MEYTRKRLRKRPYERNDTETKKVRRLFAREISRIPNRQLFYFDQTGVNLHTGPEYGYAPIGQSISSDQPGNRGKNVSIMGIIGESGLIHFEFLEGAYNGARVRMFLDNSLPKLPKDAIVVMDNAVIHKSNIVLQAYTNTGLKHKFLPRYSPQLNPIEIFWHIMKSRQRIIRPRPKTRDELHDSVNTVFDNLWSYRCDNLNKNMREWQGRAMDDEDFP